MTTGDNFRKTDEINALIATLPRVYHPLLNVERGWPERNAAWIAMSALIVGILLGMWAVSSLACS